MIRCGYATGHGDTIEDLLSELDWQIDEKVKAEREECAVVAFNEAYSDEEACHISEAIRARSEK